MDSPSKARVSERLLVELENWIADQSQMFTSVEGLTPAKLERLIQEIRRLRALILEMDARPAEAVATSLRYEAQAIRADHAAPDRATPHGDPRHRLR